jgi:ABC-2 type transport system permease protein
MLRVISQVTFFALIGSLVGSREQAHFILVGNVVLVGAMVIYSTSASTVWERWSGSLPLLFSAPSQPLLVLMGRSFNWVPDALFSATGAFFIAGSLFDLPMPWPRVLLVIPVLAVTYVATYGFGLFLGSLSIRSPESRNFISRVAGTVTMAIAGANVPVDFFPLGVQRVAQLLPPTHGVRAVRALLDGSTAFPALVATVVTGLLWYLVAAASLHLFEVRSRRTGTLEFG